MWGIRERREWTGLSVGAYVRLDEGRDGRGEGAGGWDIPGSWRWMKREMFFRHLDDEIDDSDTDSLKSLCCGFMEKARCVIYCDFDMDELA